MTSFFTQECDFAQCGQENFPVLVAIASQSGSSTVSPVATNLEVPGQRISNRRNVLGALRGTIGGGKRKCVIRVGKRFALCLRHKATSRALPRSPTLRRMKRFRIRPEM